MNAATKSNADAQRVILIHGEDEFQVLQAAREQLAELCPPEQQAQTVEVVEGGAGNGAEIEAAVSQTLQALRTVSMFGDEQIVWLRGVNFLPETKLSQSALAKEQIALLEAFIKKGLSDGQVLLISSLRRVSGRMSFLKTLKKVGKVVVFEPPKKTREIEEQARAQVAAACRKSGIKAAPPLLNAILDRTGMDSRQIFNEVEKLSLYMGERKEVELADVRAIVAPTREAMAWDFTDAVARRDLPGSLHQLQTLIHQKASPMMLIVMLANRFREMTLFRSLLDEGLARVEGSGNWFQIKWNDDRGAAAAAGVLGKVPNPWSAGKMAQASRAYSPDQLYQAQRLITDTHDQLMWSGLPQEMLMEMLVIRLHDLVADRSRRTG